MPTGDPDLLLPEDAKYSQNVGKKQLKTPIYGRIPILAI
jgi:hypothetical protein